MSIQIPSWSDFYRAYKNDPEKGQRWAFDYGKTIGQGLMTKLNLKANDLDTLAKVLNAFFKEIKTESSAKVEGNKVVVQNRTFCGIMISAKEYNIPWLWLDENVAWPLMQSLADAVNPNIKHRVNSARVRGDEVCEHVWELTQ